MLARWDWQFHWVNRGYGSFEDFLSTLRSRKRKNIRRERRQVREAGIRYIRKTGEELSEEDLDFVYYCYRRTFQAHGNHAALSRQFFSDLAAGCRDRLLVIMAERDAQPLAMSLYLAGGGRLYGRYWGCTEELPGLHFETAYYQGMDYCIEHGIAVFESGAQGEHKISRGFTPVRTRSYHLVRDELFRAAIADALERESEWLTQYREELARHEPYRVESPP
jgi:predicted N-acyltransferase